MTTAGEYRAKAQEFRAMAHREASTVRREEYERLAQCYVGLANLAERNSRTDVVYETPSPPATGGSGQDKPSEPAT